MSQEPAAASCSIATVNSHSFRPEDPLKVVPLLALSSLNSLLPTLALSLPLCLARSLFLSLPPPTLALSLSLSLSPPSPSSRLLRACTRNRSGSAHSQLPPFVLLWNFHCCFAHSFMGSQDGTISPTSTRQQASTGHAFLSN